MRSKSAAVDMEYYDVYIYIYIRNVVGFVYNLCIHRDIVDFVMYNMLGGWY